jgi:hypothetical protein
VIPILVSHFVDNGEYEQSILATAFPASVVAVRLWIAGRKSRVVSLRIVGRRQAKVAGLDRFRYAVTTYAGDFCLVRYAAFDRSGRQVEISDETSCADG